MRRVISSHNTYMYNETKNNLPPIESARVAFSEALSAYLLKSLPETLSFAQADRVRQTISRAIKNVDQKHFNTLFRRKEAQWVLLIVDTVVKAISKELEENPLKGRLFVDKKANEIILDFFRRKNFIGTNATIVAELLTIVGVTTEENAPARSFVELKATERLIETAQPVREQPATVQPYRQTGTPESRKNKDILATDLVQVLKKMSFAEIKTYLQNNLDLKVVGADSGEVTQIKTCYEILLKCEEAFILEPESIAKRLDVWRLTAPSIFGKQKQDQADLRFEIFQILIAKTQEADQTVEVVQTAKASQNDDSLNSFQVLTTTGTPFVPSGLPENITWEERKRLMVGAITPDRRIDEEVYLRNVEALKRSRLS